MIVSRDFHRLVEYLLSKINYDKNKISYDEIYRYFNDLALNNDELYEYYSGETYPENGYSVCPELVFDIQFLISIDALSVDTVNSNTLILRKEKLQEIAKLLDIQTTILT